MAKNPNSGVRYMGAWTTGTNYPKDDIVKNSVSTFICLVDQPSWCRLPC